MTETPSSRAWELLRAALEVPPAQRDHFVSEACGTDTALHAEVSALLRVDADADSLLDARLDPQRILGDDAGAAPGETIGGYRLLAELGRGGMGTVYRAERIGGVAQHHVALKLIKRGMDTDEIVRRFLRERDILAQLKHPNIARLIDGGASERGQAWFAMELIDGAPITHWCDAHALGLRERIACFLDVCAAVQHAHRNLIVHRDLKPGNILVGGEREVKLLDFGIAKLLDDPRAEAATRTQQRMLTPEFAAPEQFRGAAITTATDVYQLGLVLYELLCGRRALRGGGGSIPRLTAALVTAHADEPDAATIAARRAQSVPALRKVLRGDLERIVQKALDEEPARRYDSVAELGADLRRYLDGQPVHAAGNRWSYRAFKFARRHRVGVGAALLIVLAVAAGVAGTLWQAREARRAAADALAAAARADQIKDFIASVFSAADPYANKGGATTVRDLLDTARARIGRELGAQPEIAVELLDIVGKSYLEIEEGEAARATFQQALTIAESAFRAPHHWRTYTRFLLARATEEASQIEAATKLLDATIAEQRRLGAAGVAELVESLQERVSIHGMRHNLDAAIADASEAAALAQRTLGENTPAYFQSLRELAMLENQHGSHAAALAKIERAAALARAYYHDARHPTVLDVSEDLGRVRGDNGRHDEALAVLHEVVDARRAIFGDHHIRLGSALDSLGVEQMRDGDYAAAIATLCETVALFRAASEAGPHMSAVAQAELAQAELLQGDFANAAHDAQAVADGLSMLGARSRTWLSARVTLGAAQWRLQQREPARVTLREAAKGWDALAPELRSASLAHAWLALTFANDTDKGTARAELARARAHLEDSTFRGDQALLEEIDAALGASAAR